MSKVTVIENEFATLLHDVDEKLIHHIFHKPIGGENFRSILDTGVKIMTEHGAIKWLSDDRANSALSEEDTKWALEDWSVRALEAGWKYWALVVPPDIKARMNLSEFVFAYAEKGLTVRVFTDPKAALDWITKTNL